MPPAVPIVAAAASYAATAVIANGFASVVVGFALSTAINSVGSRMFASRPKANTPSQAAQGQKLMIRSSVESHKVIYGQTRVSGPMVFAATTDTGPLAYGAPVAGTNVMLHMIVALAGHEVEEIGTVYLGDRPLTLNADGYATNLPYAYYPAGTAASAAINTATRSDEVVTAVTSAPHGIAPGDQVDVTVTSDPSMGGSYIVLSAPTSTSFTYANGGPNASAAGGTAKNNTLSGTLNSYVRVKKHTGAVGQAADADLIAEMPGWDSDHRLSGVAYVYLRLQFSQEVFTQGIPNISAVVKGKRVYDPRDGSTAYSTNAALCTRDYMTEGYGFACDPDEINDDYFSAAANACDEDVTLTTGGTQRRYTVNGVLDTATAPLENLNALVAAMAGAVTYVQGQFRGYAGTYDAPGGDIDLDMLADELDIVTDTARESLFNAVKGVHVNPAKQWTPTDFPFVTNATYEAQDGGQQIFTDIQLLLTNHPEAAQRIGKVILEQARQGITVNLPLNHKALQFAVWDTVRFTNPPVGWHEKVFRIKKMSTTGVGPILLQLQEESSASYNWNNGEATVLDPAPDTNLPNPLFVQAPNGLSYSSRAVAATGGVSVYNLVLMWNPHPDVFVQQGGQIEIQYKLSAEAEWRPSFFVKGDIITADILSSSLGESYDIRIRALNAGGKPSGWTTLINCVIGSSGGVTTSNDWGDFHSSPSITLDWGDFTTPPSSTDIWGFFT